MTEHEGEQQQVKQKSPGGGELTEFERLSAVIPKKTPLAILIGAALIPVVLWIINVLAPTEAVEEGRKLDGEEGPAASASAGGPDIDEI